MLRLLQKIEKAGKSLSNPRFRRALWYGVAPSFEHLSMLRGLGTLKTIVGVGANVGQFALISHHVHPAAQIHSFEPLSRPREVFASVMMGVRQVNLHPFALGDANTSMEVHVSNRADSSSLLPITKQAKFYPGTHEVGVEYAKVVRLDYCLSPSDIISPALLKIDVQGYEKQVLEGCIPLLSGFDYIFVELSFVELYEGQALAPALIELLAAHRFELSGVYVSPLSYKGDQMIQGDFLFSRREAA